MNLVLPHLTERADEPPGLEGIRCHGFEIAISLVMLCAVILTVGLAAVLRRG